MIREGLLVIEEEEEEIMTLYVSDGLCFVEDNCWLYFPARHTPRTVN
jgi:hypothetical protein